MCVCVSVSTCLCVFVCVTDGYQHGLVSKGKRVSLAVWADFHPSLLLSAPVIHTHTHAHTHTHTPPWFEPLPPSDCVCVCVCVCVHIQYVCVDLCVGATVHIRGSYPRYPESQGHIWSKDSEQKEFTSLCRHETPRVLV